FTGKERDTESGNDYMFARYYNSATGRFLSPDWSAKVAPVPYAKLDDPQSLNLYSYVRNNPMDRFDPDGHKDWCAGSGAGTLACSVQTDWNKAHEIVQQTAKKVGSYIYLKGEKEANGANSGDSFSAKVGPVKVEVTIGKDVNEETRHLDGSKKDEHVKENSVGVEIAGVGSLGVTKQTQQEDGHPPQTQWSPYYGQGSLRGDGASGQVGVGVEFCHGICSGIEGGIEAGKIYSDYTHWVANNPQYF
ncbi:MAG: RHS repeat-associated core domain-containing protein, partial [Negativicutes bacterium]|nr:RHS repeat-associated core domain-containing protein [Negativicutes bacterium]